MFMRILYALGLAAETEKHTTNDGMGNCPSKYIFVGYTPAFIVKQTWTAVDKSVILFQQTQAIQAQQSTTNI